MPHAAYVLGARGGIGIAVTERLMRSGDDVYACWRSSDPELVSHYSALARDCGVRARCEEFDASKIDELEFRFQRAESDFAPCQKLVVTVGSLSPALLLTEDEDGLERAWRLNFLVPVMAARAVARTMMRSRKGSIVFMSSIRATHPERGTLAYGSSKAALEAAVRILAQELTPFGITVNAVALGPVASGMLAEASEVSVREMLEGCPAGRFCTPDEAASAVHFLLSDESTHISGSVLSVDGGSRW